MEAVHILVLGMVQGQGRASDFSETISGMTCLSFPHTSLFSFFFLFFVVGVSTSLHHITHSFVLLCDHM